MLVALSALFLISCGGGASTPSDAAAKVYDLMIDGDFEAASKCFYFGNENPEQEAQAQAMIASMLTEKAAPQIEAKGGLKSVDVLGETIAEDGKSANVEVKMLYGDGTEQTSNVDMVLDADGDWRPTMKK